MPTAALIVEDRRLADFLVPAIRSIACGSADDLEVYSPEPVRGCRAQVLQQRIEGVLRQADIIVIGVDSAAPGHARRARTHRQKAKYLRSVVHIPASASLAVAAPCVEAWLLADPAAFAAGLEAGVGRPFTRPHIWPTPADERDAKRVLGSVISDGFGAQTVLSRSGFEFADEIVGRARLVDSSSESLAEWARDLRRRLDEIPS